MTATGGIDGVGSGISGGSGPVGGGSGGFTGVGGGSGNTATGQGSSAFGETCNATAEAAVAEGENTTASGEGSHAEGISTTASGAGSHAEGGSTVAGDDGAHAEGNNTYAAARNSHAEGEHTIADGVNSSASGYYSSTRAMIASQAYSGGRFFSPGDSQTRRCQLKGSSLNNGTTPIQLTVDATFPGTSPGTTNQVQIISDSSYAIEVNVVGRRQTQGDTFVVVGMYGAFKNIGGSITQVGSTVIPTPITDTGASGWSVALAVDSDNGAIAVVATGDDTGAILWTAEVKTQELQTDS